MILLLAVALLTLAMILSPFSTQTVILLATSENDEDDSNDGDGNGDSSDGDNGNSDQPAEEAASEPQPQPQLIPQQQQSQLSQQQQQPSPSTPQQDGQQQEPPLENFIISGKIVSLLPIENNTWIADGDWRMVAENGKAKSFSTQMVWTSADGTQSHTHEIQNLRLLDNNTNVAMAPGITLNLDGVLDVGTNGVIDWPGVPSRVYFGNGQTIVVAIDDAVTNYHFGGQPIYGLVTSFSPCGAPGPSMEVLPRCE